MGVWYVQRERAHIEIGRRCTIRMPCVDTSGYIKILSVSDLKAFERMVSFFYSASSQ